MTVGGAKSKNRRLSWCLPRNRNAGDPLVFLTVLPLSDHIWYFPESVNITYGKRTYEEQRQSTTVILAFKSMVVFDQKHDNDEMMFVVAYQLILITHDF